MPSAIAKLKFTRLTACVGIVVIVGIPCPIYVVGLLSADMC